MEPPTSSARWTSSDPSGTERHGRWPAWPRLPGREACGTARAGRETRGRPPAGRASPGRAWPGPGSRGRGNPGPTSCGPGSPGPARAGAANAGPRPPGDPDRMQRSTAAPRRRLSGTTKVWLLSGAIAVAAVFPSPAGVPPLPTRVEGDWRPLPLLAGLFYLAELTVVHFRFRRDAHSFSLSEVPLVLGLFFAAPWTLVPAQLIGSALALTLHRRQPVLKLAFNLSQFALQGALAVVVFRYVVALGDPLGPAGWMAALLATQVTLWVADAAINAAIHLSGDRLPPQAMWEVLGLGVIATAMNTSLALIAVTILARSPASAWLALTPLV